MSGNLIICRCETVYFMIRRKLLHRMKEVCGAASRIMKDELIVGEHQVDGTRLLIYIHIYLYIDVYIFLPYLRHCILYNDVLYVYYYIEGHFFILFFVSIIGCHNSSYSTILNSFLYLQIQLYDTSSLSLSFMCIGYCAIELRSHGIHKATEAKDLCAV